MKKHFKSRRAISSLLVVIMLLCTMPFGISATADELTTPEPIVSYFCSNEAVRTDFELVNSSGTVLFTDDTLPKQTNVGPQYEGAGVKPVEGVDMGTYPYVFPQAYNRIKFAVNIPKDGLYSVTIGSTYCAAETYLLEGDNNYLIDGKVISNGEIINAEGKYLSAGEHTLQLWCAGSNRYHSVTLTYVGEAPTEAPSEEPTEEPADTIVSYFCSNEAVRTDFELVNSSGTVLFTDDTLPKQTNVGPQYEGAGVKPVEGVNMGTYPYVFPQAYNRIKFTVNIPKDGLYSVTIGSTYCAAETYLLEGDNNYLINGEVVTSGVASNPEGTYLSAGEHTLQLWCAGSNRYHSVTLTYVGEGEAPTEEPTEEPSDTIVSYFCSNEAVRTDFELVNSSGTVLFTDDTLPKQTNVGPQYEGAGTKPVEGVDMGTWPYVFPQAYNRIKFTVNIPKDGLYSVTIGSTYCAAHTYLLDGLTNYLIDGKVISDGEIINPEGTYLKAGKHTLKLWNDGSNRYHSVTLTYVGEAPTKEPSEDDDSNIVRFGVLSDSHQNFDALANAANTLYAIDAGLDGLVLAGDIIYMQAGNVDASLYDDLIAMQVGPEGSRTTIGALIDSGKISFAMGNHECPLNGNSTAMAEAVKAFNNKTELTANDYAEIGGYPVISIAASDYFGNFSDETAAYLKTEVEKALENTTGPVFINVHQGFENTFIGTEVDHFNSAKFSDEADSIIAEIKSNPRVIAFSGHTHYAEQDPRNIYQEAGGFTAALTSHIAGGNALSDFETSDAIVSETHSQCLLVEIDKTTNAVTIKRVDVKNGGFIGSPYEIDITGENQPYTYEARMAQAIAPSFAEDAVVTASNITENSATLTFNNATLFAESDTNYAHYYEVTVTDENGSLHSKTKYRSDIASVPQLTAIPIELYHLTFDTTYNVSVKAGSPYGKWSEPITTTFTTEDTSGIIVSYFCSNEAVRTDFELVNSSGTVLFTDDTLPKQTNQGPQYEGAGTKPVEGVDMGTWPYVFPQAYNRIKFTVNIPKDGLYSVTIGSTYCAAETYLLEGDNNYLINGEVVTSGVASNPEGTYLSAGEHTLQLWCAGSNRYHSVTLTYIGKADTFDVESVKTADDEAITAANVGSLTGIKVTAAKNSSQDETGMFIVAFYNGNRLISTATASATVSGSMDEINIELSESPQGATRLECFVWSGLSEMSPLSSIFDRPIE